VPTPSITVGCFKGWRSSRTTRHQSRWQSQTPPAGPSEHMAAIPDNGVALAFTSPPYNVGKTYDKNWNLPTYLKLIQNVA